MTEPTNILVTQNECLENDNALIIFIKNPQLGKVKTRLAATVGNEKALEIYHILTQHTHVIVNDLKATKYLYYSDFVDVNDSWQNDKFQKLVQFAGQDLGLKMASAFSDTANKKHKKALIIGSDCLELTQKILDDAYDLLSDNEVVIGPASDGGYYLIGFSFERIGENSDKTFEKIFFNKQWSHENVCTDAIHACVEMNINYSLLPTLTDVDEEKDYLNTQHLALKFR